MKATRHKHTHTRRATQYPQPHNLQHEAAHKTSYTISTATQSATRGSTQRTSQRIIRSTSPCTPHTRAVKSIAFTSSHSSVRLEHCFSYSGFHGHCPRPSANARLHCLFLLRTESLSESAMPYYERQTHHEHHEKEKNGEAVKESAYTTDGKSGIEFRSNSHEYKRERQASMRVFKWLGHNHHGFERTCHISAESEDDEDSSMCITTIHFHRADRPLGSWCDLCTPLCYCVSPCS
jgi:hypothetical protein